MKFNHYFLPQGAVVNIDNGKFIFKSFFQGKESIQEWEQKKSLIFDTGNHLSDGIIDHHQPGTEDLCVTSLVALYPEKYLGHIDKSLDEVNIITHFFPDFDAIGSTYLAIRWLKEGKMPDNANILADYVNEVDSGKLTLDINYPISPASMILAISDKISKDNNVAFPNKHKEILDNSYSFLDRVFEILPQNSNPWRVDFLENLIAFQEYKENIKKDVFDYQEDLNRSIFLTTKLINNQTNIIEDVDFIATDNPKSFLWKYWVRGDRNNSPQKNGFIFTCAFFDTFKAQGRNRAIISTDPNTPYSLKGLGLLIERLEIEKLLYLGETIGSLTDNSRPGFHRADPWYDGRAPVHNYTIIDAPRVGSTLSNDELIDIIGRYEYWNEIGKNLPNFNDIENVLSLPFLSNSDIEKNFDPNDLNGFTELDFENFDLFLNNISNTLNNFKYFSIKSNILEQKRTNYRNQILGCFIDFINKIQESERNIWGDKLTKIIVKYLPNEFIYRWLKESTGLSVNSVVEILNRFIPTIEEKEYYHLLLELNNKHFNSFTELTKLSKSHNIFTFNEKNIALVNLLLELIDIQENDNETINNLSIYAFENVKNYFDDIFVSQSFRVNGKIEEKLGKYIFDDFVKITQNDYYQSKNFYDEFEYFFALYIEKEIFGEQYKNFRDLKSKLLQSVSGKKFGSYKKISPEEYFDFSYTEIKNCISYFNSRFSDENPDEILFLNYLKIAKNKIAFRNLSNRINHFRKIKSLLNNNIIVEYLNNYYRDILIFIEITNRFSEFVISYNEISTDAEADNRIGELIELLDKISIETKSIKNEYFQLFLDNLYEFLNKKSGEYKIPISQTQEIIDLCLQQFNSISNNESGLLVLSEISLPKSFFIIYKDTLTSLKRYYLKKIEFIQNSIKKLEETEESSEDSEFKSTKYSIIVNNILFNTVKFDWKGLKTFVDSSDNLKIKENFYQKYFYWSQLYLIDDNLDNNTHRIHKLNSKFRKVFGEKTDDFLQSLDKLPYEQDWYGYDEHFKTLVNNVDVDDLIEDLNNHIYVVAYEHISDFFISKFDVENLSISLENYSSKYPSYYRIFTKTSFIRTLVLMLLLLLFGAAVFDKNSYPIAEVEGAEKILAPIPNTVQKIVGESVLNVVSGFFKYFWLSLVFVVFIAPFIFGLMQIPKLFKGKKEKVNKPKFLELLRKVEDKKSSLLYLQFITPLLLVLLNIASPDTVDLLNNFTGFRFISIVLIIIGLIFVSIYREISAVNEDKPTKWLLSRTKHMIWLYYMQSLLITIFLVDLILRYQIDLSELFGETSDYFMYGLSKYIPYNVSIPAIGFDFDIVIMPVTTVLISLLSLFFSFFIDKVFGGGND